MAFAVTAYKAYSVQVGGPSSRQCVQHYEMVITGTTADIVLDFDDSAGTFWSAVDNSDLGLQAKTTFFQIADVVDHLACPLFLSGVTDGKELKYDGATLATHQYKYDPMSTVADPVPGVVLYTSEGLASYSFHMQMILTAGVAGINVN